MYERLIFATSLERDATRQLIQDNFPAATLIDAPDVEGDDFLLDVNIAIEKEVFFRWVSTTLGPCRLLLYSCYHLSMDLFDPPTWMVAELRRMLE